VKKYDPITYMSLDRQIITFKFVMIHENEIGIIRSKKYCILTCPSVENTFLGSGNSGLIGA